MQNTSRFFNFDEKPDSNKDIFFLPTSKFTLKKAYSHQNQSCIRYTNLIEDKGWFSPDILPIIVISRSEERRVGKESKIGEAG